MDSRLCAAAAARAAAWTGLEAEGLRCWTAPLDDEALVAAVTAALAEAGLAPPTDLSLIRHAGEDHGLPKGPGIGFLLDLADGRSGQGGLVMTGDDPMRGWRPEAGVLTLFDGARPPLLTTVTPGAATPRLAVFGHIA